MYKIINPVHSLPITHTHTHTHTHAHTHYTQRLKCLFATMMLLVPYRRVKTLYRVAVTWRVSLTISMEAAEAVLIVCQGVKWVKGVH